MHPIERLRYVARIEGADPSLVAQEAAAALAEVARSGEVAGLVPSCRRLLERHPANGMLWWLAARVLSAADPFHEAREAAAALAHDPTAAAVADQLPDEASALVIGWPDLAAGGLRQRGDVEALVVDAAGEGAALARWLGEDGQAVVVPDRGIGSAATVASLVLLEAVAAGPGGILAAPGSHAAAAVANRYGRPVWAVVGVGRVLPQPLWDAALGRLDASGIEPWEREVEVVPVELLDWVVRAGGRISAAEGLAVAECPAAPELLRPGI